jgi:hypothetical protein
MHPSRAASKEPRRTSVPGVLGVLGRRRAAGGEHRFLEVLHVSVPPPKPIPSAGSVRLAKLLILDAEALVPHDRLRAASATACATLRSSSSETSMRPRPRS